MATQHTVDPLHSARGLLAYAVGRKDPELERKGRAALAAARLERAIRRELDDRYITEADRLRLAGILLGVVE